MKVERLCDYFIAILEKDGSDDIRALQELKDEAADLQFAKSIVTIEGLSDYIRKGATVS